MTGALRLAFLILCFAGAFLPVSCEQSYGDERERMVREQIEARGIRNADVLRAMRETPRHLFIPEDLRP